MFSKTTPKKWIGPNTKWIWGYYRSLTATRLDDLQVAILVWQNHNLFVFGYLWACIRFPCILIYSGHGVFGVYSIFLFFLFLLIDVTSQIWITRIFYRKDRCQISELFLFIILLYDGCFFAKRVLVLHTLNFNVLFLWIELAGKTFSCWNSTDLLHESCNWCRLLFFKSCRRFIM